MGEPVTLKRVRAWVSEPLFWGKISILVESLKKKHRGGVEKGNGWDDGRSENRRMLMHTQRPQRIPHRPYLPHRPLPPYIPKHNLPIPTPRNQLAESPSLHMHPRDPLLVAAPMLDHGHGGFFASVEDADGAVGVAGAEDVAGYLVGGEGGDAGAGAGGDVLLGFVSGGVWFWAERGCTLVQISVAAFQTLTTLTSPATRSLPCPCCQSKTRPAFLVLGIRSVSARKADTSSTFFSES